RLGRRGHPVADPDRAAARDDRPLRSGDLRGRYRHAAGDGAAAADPPAGPALTEFLPNADRPPMKPGVPPGYRLPMAPEGMCGTEIDAIVARAVRAQQLFEYWTEERVDALLFDLSSAFHRRAESFAALLVEESGLGQAADKAARIREVSV